MRVNTNVPALISYNALNSTNKVLQKAIERLSTGLRVNSAADDAAGLAISEKMRSQSRGLDQAVKNAQDGISMIQTAEGAMNEVHSILQRMRELSVQAANDTLTMDDREFVQLEIDQLKEEIDRIAFTTQFNKKKLLDGSSDALWSTDLLGTRVFVNGSMLSRDQFGQVLKFEGNFIISATAAPGQNQVLKSNIFTVPTSDGAAAASVFSHLMYLTNFTNSNGVSILADPQELTVSMEGGDSVTVMVYASDSIETLGDKLNAAIAKASGIVMPEHVGVQYVSDGGQLAWLDADEAILKAATNWIQGAAERVYNAYGLAANGETLHIKLVDDFPGNVGATANVPPGGGEGTITLSRDTFASLSPFLDTGMGHEMTHILTFLDAGINNAMRDSSGTWRDSGMWLIEGLAEYTVGTNYKVQSTNRAAVENMLSGVSGTLLNPNGAGYGGIYGNGDDVAYAAAYLAVRYYDKMASVGSGTGIKGLLQALSTAGPGSDLDAAIFATSGGAYSSFSDFSSEIVTTLTNGTFHDFYNDVMNENVYWDTGAIGGAYASGGPAWNSSDVVPDYQNNDPDGLVGGTDAWAKWGAVTWPTEITGGPMDSVISISKTVVGTFQSVDGTLLLHSNVLGSAGKITISGDEDLIKALGFTEVQSARETVYDINIIDAHTGNVVKSGVRISGNTMYGELHENIDIRMLNNFSLDIDADALQQDDGYGSYIFSASATLNSFVVHIAENSVVLQIGANEREDMFISFGDVTSASLGIEHVSVRDRELAARAVTVIDGAISKVSTKRARLGAYQNRLEHTITNLTATAANMTAAESRIRDADMAKAIIDFTRLNILSQTGNSMLAQANQLPSNILTLLR